MMTATLIYDGDCGFCTSRANWIQQRGRGQVVARAWQTLDLDDFGLTEHEVSTALYWIDHEVDPDSIADGPDRAFRGHAAVARSLETIGGFYHPVGWILRRPPVSLIARPAYRLAARYRHRLPGATDACAIDTSAID